MNIAGHTMGTPELTLEQAAKLFSELGLNAIEVIFQDNYLCGFNWDTADEQVIEYKRLLDKLGLEASCVVSYASDYNAIETAKREAAIKDCLRCIEIAGMLSAGYIRIYGGTFLAGDGLFDEKRSLLVESMRMLADRAKEKNAALVLENHFNTMTTGPAITIDIVKEIDRDNVGILYDQTNISFLSGEDYKTSIALQKDKIFYVHVKDFVFKREGLKFSADSVSHVKEEERAVISKIPGEGIVPWPCIIKELDEIGYKGYLSLEYERRWHPQDLPVAAIGMKKGAENIIKILNDIEKR